MIMLSRNTPLAFVVGAAGFLGSHLVDKLLEKSIQVVGLDDLSTGTSENLNEAVKNKHFHFINQSADDELVLDLPRLDYAYFVISEMSPAYQKAFKNFLNLCKKYKSKIILVSSIELYDLEKEGLEDLREAEKQLARFAVDNKLNARVARLAPVFGPRMNFDPEEPLSRLIKIAVLEQLQTETTPLDFTTRSLFVSDAVELLIKAVMHGSTAQKIYDGALLCPIKITEIKQILLDPLWHEKRGFAPTELPPWPTPNLLKTIKELSWHPDTKIVEALRKTVSFFKDRPELVVKIKEGNEEKVPAKDWSILFPKKVEENLEENKPLFELDKFLPKKTFWKQAKKLTLFFIVLLLIIFAFIYPGALIATGILDVKTHLQNSGRAVEIGDFDQAKKEINEASLSGEIINEEIEPFLHLDKVRFIGNSVQEVAMLMQLLNLTIEASNQEIKGVKALNQGLRLISGEEGNTKETLLEASLELDLAQKQFSLIKAGLNNPKLEQMYFGMFKNIIYGLKDKIDNYRNLASKNYSFTQILSQIVSAAGEKKYLVVLEDNSKIWPSGGLVDSVALVSFKDGRLADIKIDKVGQLDKSLAEKVEPPAEIKKDMGLASWSFKEAGFDPDFPTSAKSMEWFYKKEFGEDIVGVVALDLTTLSEFVEVMGPLKLINFDGEISKNNLNDRIKKDETGMLLPAVLKEIISRMFYVPKQNWLLLSQLLGKSLDEKHIMLFMHNSGLNAYLSSLNWVGTIPRQEKEIKGEKKEFIAFYEANMGKGINTYVKRSLNLASKLDDNNGLSHKLMIDYSNENQFESGAEIYKNRFKVYLPGGSKLTKALWGDKEITKDVSSFVDYGRAGYSMLLELKSQEKKTLILEYQDLKPIELEDGQIKIKYNLVKQPGMGNDPVNFVLHYPASFKAVSFPGTQTIPQEVSFITDLAKDRNFEITLKKD